MDCLLHTAALIYQVLRRVQVEARKAVVMGTGSEDQRFHNACQLWKSSPNNLMLTM